MRDVPESVSRGNPALPWPTFGWFLPVAYAYLAYGWWDVGRSQMAVLQASGAFTAGMTHASVLLAVAARFVGWLIESAYYALWWKWRRRPLRFWRLFSWIAMFSMADLLAEAIRRDDTGDIIPSRTVRALLAGIGLLGPEGGSVSALMSAFGSLGFLTITRIAALGSVQSRATGEPWSRSLALVALTWLGARLVLWWTGDLLRGTSLGSP